MYHLGHLELHSKRKLALHEREILSTARFHAAKAGRVRGFFAALKSKASRFPFARPMIGLLKAKRT
jgi:hypothetical protein